MAFMRRRTRFLVIIAICLQVGALLTFAWSKNAFIFTLDEHNQPFPEVTDEQPSTESDPTAGTRWFPPDTSVPKPNFPQHPVTEAPASNCPSYESYSRTAHDELAPLSAGRYQLPFQRPQPACRTFNSSEVEKTIAKYKDMIKDPDLFQLFQNTFPNTLDTAIKWRGVAQNDSTEELAFVVTGDIDAMWIRDSTQQLHAYASLVTPSDDSDSLASLFRGNINLQARSITYQPWCNSYTAPEESGIDRGYHGASYHTAPYMDMYFCHTPNLEVDGFAAFLMTSYDYYAATKDTAFFGKHGWIDAVEQILNISKIQMEPFFDATTGEPLDAVYTFASTTQIFTGTLGIHGLGNPVNYTGMVKSPFRPSDDSAIFQFLVPTNMMLSSYLAKGAEIMQSINTSRAKQLAKEMKDMAKTIRDAIEKYGVVKHPDGSGRSIYAFEVDGFGGQNLMDDANVPSLLSAPLLEYVKPGTTEWWTYLNTREFVNSPLNPWYSRGPRITGIGSPHTSTGNAWPMALISTILTSSDDDEIMHNLKQLVSTTDGLGLIHESVDSRRQRVYTRQWFAWANSYFGQMILDLGERKPHILAKSFQ